MKKENDKNSNTSCRARRTQKLSIVVAATLFSFGATSALATTEFHPRATISASWIDNLTLVGDDDPTKESGYVLQVNPGFTFTQHAQRFDSSLRYTMQNVYFPGDSDRNSTFHQGEAGFASELLSNFFYVDGSATYSQQIVDPKQPANNSNLFAVANQADALAAHATTVLRHEFDAFRMDARYTRGLVDYKSTTGATLLQDADTQAYSGLLGSADEQARLTWEGRYEQQRAKYKNSPEYKFEQANAELGLLLGKSLRLIGRGGLESDPVADPTKGGLDNETWEAGFRYSPSQRTELEAFYGDRFYGKAYRGSFHHEARRAKWNVSYAEGPMTQAQELILQPVTIGTAAQTSNEPGSIAFSRELAAIFVRKTLEANVHIDGQRTSIDLFAIDYRREYLTAIPGNDEHMKGGSVGLTRRLSSRTDLIVSTRLDDSDLADGNGYRELSFGMEWRHRITEKLRSSIGLTRLDRTGNADYTANWITASVVGEF